jgi:hypothetical protein
MLPARTTTTLLPLVVLLGISTLATVAQVPQQNLPLKQGNILDSLEVDLGDRSIFLNRIEPPVLKPWVKPVAAAVESALVYEPTADELAEEKRLSALRYEWINLEAAVYVGQGTEIRMWTEQGEVVALSSIDFRIFDWLLHFEAEGVYYNLFCMAHSWTKQELAEWWKEDPTAEWPVKYQAFPQVKEGISRFEVLSAPAGKAGEAALEAMEALHAYHDANRKALMAGFEAREEARLIFEAEEAVRKANPEPPKDTVISYFPIRSVYAPGDNTKKGVSK